MNRLRAWLIRLGGVLPNNRREQELADEIESHLQLHIDDNIRVGMTPDQARRAAVLKLGGVEPTKEAWRDRRSIPFLDHLLQDVRFSVRQLRKNPGFSFTAILMLALGVCASTAIFAFVDATLIKPLPYRDPATLVGVFEKIPLCQLCPLSYPDYVDWKRLNRVFASMDVFEGRSLTLLTAEGAQQAPGAVVSAGFFRTLGVTPILGRDFTSGEDQPGARFTVMLSHAAWQKRYGGRPDVLGRTVTLNGNANTIIGVLPPDFHFAAVGLADFWTALNPSGGCYTARGCHSLLGVARVRGGVSLDAVRANLALIAQQLEAQYPDSNRGQGSNIATIAELTVGRIRRILLVLLGGAALLLLIASTNVASLLLVRSESRKREIAVRSGLGASPARLIAQFVTEGLVLVAGGAVLGLLSAQWAIQALARRIPEGMLASMPFLVGIGLNLRVLAFACAVSLLAALLFSITPALRLSLHDLREGLVEGTRGTAGMKWRRLGSNLVVVELAMAVVLLVGAGLLGKSLYRLLQVDLGFRPDHLATLRVAASEVAYPKNEQKVALARQVVNRIASLPGVESAALTGRLPLIGGNTMWIRVVGHPYHGEHNEVSYREVSSAYFTTLGAKLLKGRYIADEEDASKPAVVVIDQSLANKYFPGEDPIGKQIQFAPTTTQRPMEVIGVIENIKEALLDGDAWPTMYVPFYQDPSTHFSVVVRTSRDERSVLPTLSTAIHRIDPTIATFDELSMSERITHSPSAYFRLSSTWLVGGFAATALLLGVVGLYGVVAYSVSRRTREIGVRMALGAQPSSVSRLVLKEASRLIAAGIVLGLGCAIAAATLIRSLLFDVRSWDVATLATVAAVLGVSALAASYLPARRAASVNPVDALRAE